MRSTTAAQCIDGAMDPRTAGRVDVRESALGESPCIDRCRGDGLEFCQRVSRDGSTTFDERSVRRTRCIVALGAARRVADPALREHAEQEEEEAVHEDDQRGLHVVRRPRPHAPQPGVHPRLPSRIPGTESARRQPRRGAEGVSRAAEHQGTPHRRSRARRRLYRRRHPHREVESVHVQVRRLPRRKLPPRAADGRADQTHSRRVHRVLLGARSAPGDHAALGLLQGFPALPPRRADSVQQREQAVLAARERRPGAERAAGQRARS